MSEQTEKVSADMIANIDNQGGPLSPAESFITKKEVARRLGRGVRTIDSWKQLGLLPYYKMGKCVYFRWSEVQEAIAHNGRRMN
ncbi:MAG: Helix-turn-helix domain protein [Verrucomicrobiales bacterium]|nr:Helix-turn-helix domain protein [Verrucomicrobiales bacterium]